MGRPGTLIGVRVNYFRYVSPARPYTRPPVLQGSPTNADLNVTVQLYDLLTGDPVGPERTYTASAVNGDGQSTNLQVRSMAQRIMTDWRASATPAAPAPSPRDASPKGSGADRAEVVFWESVRNSRNPDELQAYVDRYPNGTFVPLAKARIAALGGKR